MRQRLDIADVEERTKIRAKYLRALENEEWGLLPGPTFVKTFLRTYAEVVGVDPHLLVEEYRVNHEPREEYEFQPLASVPPRDSRRAGRRSPPGPPRRGVVVASLLVAGLAFLLVLGLMSDEDDGGGGEQAARTTTTDATKQPNPSREQPRRKAAPAGVNLRIAPIEPTYLCVDTGPGTDVVYENTLAEPRTFRNPQRLRVNLGRRSAEMRLNGKPVEVVDGAEPLGLELTRQGSTEIESGERPCA